MLIKKILNNNVVIAVATEHGKETIIMANGIGFHKKVGEVIEEVPNQQVFVLSDDIYDKYVKLTAHIDPRAATIAEKVIGHAEQSGIQLNELIHLTLTDHIDGVLTRLEKGLSIPNQLNLEMSRIYETEYQIGLYACQLLAEETGFSVLNDEAAFVAMHILNNRRDSLASETEVQTTLTFISDIIKVVETHFHCQYDETSFSYYRFVMHLKGLVKRIYANKPFEADDTLYETLVATYPEPARCAEKVVKMIFLKYNQDVSSEERAYLILYIEKLNRERKIGS